MDDGDYGDGDDAGEGVFGDDGVDDGLQPEDDDGEDLGGGELVLSAVQTRVRTDVNVLLAALGARMVPDKVDLPKVRDASAACIRSLLAKWASDKTTTVNVVLRPPDREAPRTAVAKDEPQQKRGSGVKRPFSSLGIN